jgi:hypothetical protein
LPSVFKEEAKKAHIIIFLIHVILRQFRTKSTSHIAHTAFNFFFEKKDLNCRGATGKDKTRQTFALPHHLFARRQHSAHMKYEHRHKYYFQLVLSYLMIPSQNMHYSITVNIQATSNKKQHSIQPC